LQQQHIVVAYHVIFMIEYLNVCDGGIWLQEEELKARRREEDETTAAILQAHEDESKLLLLEKRKQDQLRAILEAQVKEAQKAKEAAAAKVPPATIQTPSQRFWIIRSIKHGLAHLKLPSAWIFQVLG
jgi:hypothetical protein